LSTQTEPFDLPVFSHLVDQALKAVKPQDQPRRWLLLEAAHMVAQTRLVPHARAHALMLTTACHADDWAEAMDQAFRLALVPLGHLSGRLPLGNTGRSNVSAFKPIEIKPEIRQVIEDARRRVQL